MHSFPRSAWRVALVGLWLVLALLAPQIPLNQTSPVYADDPTLTPSISPTPINWGGQGDDDDM